MVLKYLNGESLFIPILVMKIGGNWPLDRTKRGSLFVFVISSALKVTAITTTLIDAHQNVRPGLDALLTCAYLLVSLLETFFIRINSGRLVRLIESKNNDWSSVTNPKERAIMKRHKIFGASFFIVSVLNSFVFPMVRVILFFPFYARYKLSVQQQTAINDHYTRASVNTVFLCVVSTVDALVKYGTRMLFWSLNTHLVEQFKILRRHFVQVLRIRNKNKSHRRFRSLVDKHNQLLNLSDDLENSFSGFLGMQVSIHQICICYSAYHLALAKLNGNLMALAGLIEAIAYDSWLLFLLYYSGQCLISCSEEIGDVFKGCKWYNLSKDSRINFSIVILQSQRPKKLTTAGLFTLSLSNYKYMVQSVYSYISLILAITKNEV